MKVISSRCGWCWGFKHKHKYRRSLLRWSSSSSSSFSSPTTSLQHQRQRDLPRVIQALDAAAPSGTQQHEHDGIWSDPLTCSHLIKSCSSLHQLRLLHRHLFSTHRPPPFLFLSNMLLSGYLKFNSFSEAHSLFDHLPHRNVVSWTTIISAYSNHPDLHHHHHALRLLVLMLREGVPPNMYTFSSVLRTCRCSSHLAQLHSPILKLGFDSDVFVRSALIDSHSKLGRLDSALLVFHDMPTGDPVVWNSIIAAFSQNSDGHEALTLFKGMKRAGFPADQSSLTSILRACTGLSLLELGRQVHVHVFKYAAHDLILNNALLDMYCKCGSLEDANSVFLRMAEKDVISWTTMVAGFAQNGYSKDALRLFHSMKASGIKPNYITLLGVLFACSHAGLVDDGWYYFRSMKTLHGIDPGREHYGCMIDLLGRAGKLHEAIGLINEMECEPDAVTWRALLGACRVHRNVDLAIHAAQQILRLDPQDAGTYILLSNIYAHTQRWDDVARVRATMNDRGIRKEPGCSWIEVDKQIHAFILGDGSHPQINEINTQLNHLIHKLMVVGYAPDTNFVLQDLEGEQKDDSLRYHSEKLALVFGLMKLTKGQTIRIRKNLRICGDCHLFAKLVAKMEQRVIVIRDPIRYHHFRDGVCSCGDYW